MHVCHVAGCMAATWQHTEGEQLMMATDGGDATGGYDNAIADCT